MRTNTNIDGWEIYPENLDLVDRNNYTYDSQSYREQLLKDSDRLFVHDERLNLKVVELGKEGEMVCRFVRK
jgi:hypothetical protein